MQEGLEFVIELFKNGEFVKGRGILQADHEYGWLDGPNIHVLTFDSTGFAVKSIHDLESQTQCRKIIGIVSLNSGNAPFHGFKEGICYLHHTEGYYSYVDNNPDESTKVVWVENINDSRTVEFCCIYSYRK